MKSWLNMINETCAPIIESGDVRYLLSGEGCEIPSLQELLRYLNAPAQIYVPQTIGVRDCSYVTCLGLFYSWREQMAIPAGMSVYAAIHRKWKKPWIRLRRKAPSMKRADLQEN